MYRPGLAALLSSLLVVALAVTPIYDETLWTKQLWVQRWKLDKAQYISSPTDDNPTLLSAYPDARGAVLSSLEGPGPRVQPHTGKTDAIDASALDDQSLLQPAAQAVRCTVCHTLVTRVWQRVVVDLLKGSITVQSAGAALPRYLNEACSKEVVSLLHRTVIYRMEVENDAHTMTFFVLRKRKQGTVPTMSERQAVQLACQEVLGSAQSQLIQLIVQQLTEFSNGLRTLLAKHGLPAIPSATQQGGDPTTNAQQNTQQQATQNTQNTGTDTAGAAAAGNAVPADATGGAGGAAGAAAGANADAAGAAAAAGNAAGAAVNAAAAAAAAGAANGGNPNPNQAVQPLLDGLVDKLLKGLAAQLKREGILIQQSEEYSGNKDDDDDEYADPDDEDEGEDCIDLHPMCQRWADEGECEANPNYMVGNSILRGHCRKACGLCAPASQTPSDVLKTHPQLAKDVQTLSNNLMQVVKSQGCGASQACLTSTTGLGGANNGVTVTAKIEGGQLKQVNSGFVLGRPSWGLPELVETDASRAVGLAQRQAHTQQQADKEGSEGATAQGGRADLQRDVDRVLSQELGGRYLRLRTEYFTYEYLYKNHTRHFHEDVKNPGQFVEDWSLGKYERESVVVEASVAQGGGVAVLHAKDLLPADIGVRMETRSWPYVKQVYGGGDMCFLGGGRQAVRRTEVRLACSPTDRIHFLVREPDFCHYIFVIYSPALCSVPHYAPSNEPTPVTDK